MHDSNSALFHHSEVETSGLSHDDGTALPVELKTHIPSFHSRLFNEVRVRRNQEAWGAFYREFSQRPLCFLKSQGYSQDAADRICQCVFAKIRGRIETLEQLPPKASVWLHQLLHRIWREVTVDCETDIQSSRVPMSAEKFASGFFSTRSEDQIADEAFELTKQKLRALDRVNGDRDIRVFQCFLQQNLCEEFIAEREGISRQKFNLIVIRVQRIFTEFRQRLSGDSR